MRLVILRRVLVPKEPYGSAINRHWPIAVIPSYNLVMFWVFFWVFVLEGCCLVGVYYLLCVFISRIRFIDGTWKFHLSLTLIFWMFPKSPKALDDWPVSRRSYILTGGGFLAAGVSGLLNHFDRLPDINAEWIIAISIVASIVAMVLDRLEAPASKDESGPSVV